LGGNFDYWPADATHAPHPVPIMEGNGFPPSVQPPASAR
jgi:hypothetical protein